MPTLEELIAALRASWSAETAFEANDWSKENPARGQCVVSSLVVQDYFGGDLRRYAVSGDKTETHYANLLESGVILDTTASQYDGLDVQLVVTPPNLKEFSSIREKCLAGESTRRRYELLKPRVAAFLAK